MNHSPATSPWEPPPKRGPPSQEEIFDRNMVTAWEETRLYESRKIDYVPEGNFLKKLMDENKDFSEEEIQIAFRKLNREAMKKFKENEEMMRYGEPVQEETFFFGSRTELNEGETFADRERKMIAHFSKGTRKRPAPESAEPQEPKRTDSTEGAKAAVKLVNADKNKTKADPRLKENLENYRAKVEQSPFHYAGGAELEASKAELAATKAELEALKEEMKKKEKKEMLQLQRTNAMQRRIEVLEGEAERGAVVLAQCSEELVESREDARRLRQEVALGEAREEQIMGDLLRAQRRNPIGHFSCTVCTENFRLVVKRPYVLACGHTFCQQCCEMLCATARAAELELQRHGERIPRRRILCPLCRQHFWTPNFRLEEFAKVNWVLENPNEEEEEEEEVQDPVVVPMEAVDQAPVVPVAEEMDDDVIILD